MQDYPLPRVEGVHPWRRFFAFYFDVLLFMLPVTLPWLYIDVDSYLAFSSLYMGLALGMLKIVTAVPLIALCTAVFGTTPGKRLLGITLEKPPEMGFTGLFKRSIYAFVFGTGLQLAAVSFVPLFFSYIRLKRTGTVQWDRLFKTKVSHSPLSGGKVTAFVLIFLGTGLLASMPIAYEPMRLMYAQISSPVIFNIEAVNGKATGISLDAHDADGGVSTATPLSGGYFSLNKPLSDLKKLTFSLPEGFPQTQVELTLKNVPKGLLSLNIKADTVTENETTSIKLTITANNRPENKELYNRVFTLSPENEKIKAEIDFKNNPVLYQRKFRTPNSEFNLVREGW